MLHLSLNIPFYLPIDPSYSRGSDIANEWEHELVKFAIVEEEGVDCVLDTVSIDDAFEVVSGAFSSISDLFAAVKGFDNNWSFLPKRIFLHNIKIKSQVML